MLSSASFGSLLLSVGLAIGLVGALLILLARRAGSPKVIYFLGNLLRKIPKGTIKRSIHYCISGGTDAILAGRLLYLHFGSSLLQYYLEISPKMEGCLLVLVS